MANLKHVVSDLHQVYLTEMEAKIKPQLDKSSTSSSGSDGGEKKDDSAGGGGDNVQKAARQLAYDTRYKARREGIPLERAFTQSVQNSSAPAPVKDAAKSLLFSGEKKESVEVEGSIEEARKGDKEKVRVEPKKGYGKRYVRFADPKKKHELRANPQIQSVTPTDYGDAYDGEKEDKKKSKDKKSKTNDGNLANNYPPYDKVTRGDVIAGAKNKDQMGGKKKFKSKNTSKSEPKESFSNWKAELGLVEETMVEVTGEGEKKFTDKKKVKNKIEIHPELKEGISKLGGEVLEIEESNDGTQEYVDFLIGEGYDCSDLTWDDMYDEYQSLDEGLRSAVKRLLGRKKEAEPEKPMSRGDQLRKKYNVGPERSDTSAKMQILKKTRAKAQRDQKDFGGSRYSKGVADKSKAAHDRYLRGGYSKYGADDKRGKGNKAAKRAAALKQNEETIREEKPYERLDRLNKERLAKQKAAKDAETANRNKRVSDFKDFRTGERAKGTRHDKILDKWQQKKIAADKAKKQ